MHSISVNIAEEKTDVGASQSSPSQRFRLTRSVAQTISAQNRKRSRIEKNTNTQATDASGANEKSSSNETTVYTAAAAINEVKREASHFTSSTERSSLGANTLQILLAPNYNNSNSNSNKNNNNTTGGGRSGSKKGNTSTPKTEKGTTTTTAL